MVRKLALAVSLALGSLSFGAQALGLGDIDTNSGLNQKLRAEINLLSVTPEEISAINVSLAPAEVFDRAGVIWYPFLSQLRFVPQVTADGRVVIGVTTDFPIREPYLDFLIKVDWPKGRLIREYTLLLDPPVTLRSSRPTEIKAAVIKPSVSQETVVAEPEPEPELEQTTISAEPPEAVTEPTESVTGEEDYRVKANDTLWGISKRLRPTGVTMEQMMMSLFHSNPNAFIKSNINLLKKGAILRVPVSTDLLDVSQAAARAEYKDQAEAWEQGVEESQAAAEELEPAVETEPVSQDDRLKLVAQTGEGVASAVEGEGELSKEAIYNELLVAQEDAATSRQDADNLRGHVDELEQQLEDMQRVLSLKDEQMARLQTGLSPDDMEGGTEETVIDAVDDTASPEQMAGDTEEAVAEASESVTDAEMAEAEPEPEPEVAQVEESLLDRVMADPAQTTAQELQGLLDELSGNETLLAALGGGAVLLSGGLLWGLLRRKESDDEEDVPVSISRVADKTESDVGDSAPTESVPEEYVESDDSFIKDFVQSDELDVSEPSLVDPIGEADVYMAYGRLDQAEEMLDQAIEDDSERVALKFKMLDVLYQAKKADAFTALAGSLKDAGEDENDPEAWASVDQMGREIAPSSPLFLDDTGVEVSSSGAESLVEDLADDLDEIPPNIEGESVDEESVFSLDVDEDLESLDEPSGFTASESEGETEEVDEESVLNLDTDLQEDDLENQLEELSDFSGLDENLEEDSVLQNEPIEELSDFSGFAEGEALEEDSVLHDSVEVPSTEGDSLSMDQIDEENEVDTKLDLARAYMEMGDAEGAQSILAEVKEEGDDSQKAVADEILSELEK